MEYIIVRS